MLKGDVEFRRVGSRPARPGKRTPRAGKLKQERKAGSRPKSRSFVDRGTIYTMPELSPRKGFLDPVAEPLDERVTITMSASLLKRIENYRFENRYRSNSDVIRDLIELGFKASLWRRSQ